MVAPASPTDLIIFTAVPDGPGALSDFIFETTFFTMSIMIGIGGLLAAIRWIGVRF